MLLFIIKLRNRMRNAKKKERMFGDNQRKEINVQERFSNLQLLDFKSNLIRSDEIYLVDMNAKEIVLPK